MNVKKALLLALLLTLPLTAGAREKEEPRTYVIKKGDTLWGISERFLKDPDYWPSLWSHNPAIPNPHFIYPGQKLLIYDGRIEIVPAGPPAASGKDAVSAGDVAPVPTEAVTVKTAGNGPGGFLSTEEFETSGVLVDAVDNRIMMATGDRVFVDMSNLSAVRPGEKYSLLATGKEITHPVTDEKVGHFVTETGTVKITDINAQVATAVITSAGMEVQRGARLRTWEPVPSEIILKRAAQPLSGVVLTGGQGQLALVQYDFIHVDLGARDGLETGNLLYVTRPRQATRFGVQGENIQLPEILLGSAVVVETQMNTATALIIKIANQPIGRGDRVVAATE